MDLEGNLLLGTLPNSWAALTQASHAATFVHSHKAKLQSAYWQILHCCTNSASSLICLHYYCVDICVVSRPLMQLRRLYLAENQLVGSLPDSWMNLTKVSGASCACIVLLYLFDVLMIFVTDAT